MKFLSFFKNLIHSKKLNKKSIEKKSIANFEEGFHIYNYTSNQTFYFENIETILAFKFDLLVVDEICLEFILNDKSRKVVSEEQNGWVELMTAIGLKFKLLDENWYINVMYPAFKTNLTLLFDKFGRKLEEIR